MLRTLIASRSPSAPAFRASTGSVGLHVAVVIGAIVWTARPHAVTAPQSPASDTITFYIPQPPTRGAGGKADPLPVPDPPLLLLDFGKVAPGPVAPLPIDSATLGMAPGPGPARSRPDTGALAPFAAALVDEAPELLTAPPLRYPELLRSAGLAGRVMIETVVDTLGRAEPGTLRVVASPHPGFDGAALAYVRGALFRPGRALGRAVRVTVHVPIEFRLIP